MNKYISLKINGKKYDEHRLIMENNIGRKLTFNEVVHHIDGNKSNNKIENLQLMSRSEHARLHSKGNDFNKNNAKLIDAGRKYRTKSPFSLSQISEIRELLKREGSSKIALKFNVNKSTICRIKNQKSYNWI